MKTPQVLTRKMKEFDVLQRTSDGMFNATALLKQWNLKYPDERRELDNFWKATHLDKLMLEIVKNEPDLSSVESTDDAKVLDIIDLKKILTQISKANKGGNAGTWMHPLLFIKFAMYLSPRFEYHVLKFVSDKLIEYRNEAGDSYKTLSSAIYQIVPKDDMAKAMKSVAKALNYVVYNSHESQMRNKQADELSLKELSELQKDVAKLINFGFINSFDQLRNFLRKLWADKWQHSILSA